MLKIRLAQEKAKGKDFDEIWRIFKKIIAAGDSYVNSSETNKSKARAKWMNKEAKTFIAENDGKILGAYLLKSNQVGRGSHIANASYITDEAARKQGIGKALALHSIAKAKELGFHAIQFNFVVSTNIPAVKLWQSVGFKIIGTTPKAFNHKDLGYVDSYIMFREL